MWVLKDEVEEAVRAALEASSGNQISRADIARAFEGRGTSRSTLYRWIAVAISSGVALRTPILEPLATEQDTAAIAASPPMAAEGVAPSAGIPVMDRVRECIQAARQAMAYARKDDGTIRNPKLLLAASEHLRRSVDTAARVREGMRQDRDLDRFVDRVLAVVAAESPPAARKITEALLELMTLRDY